MLSPASEAKVSKTSLFKPIAITKKQKSEDDDLKAHLGAIKSYLKVWIDPTQLSDGGSALFPIISLLQVNSLSSPKRPLSYLKVL
jgi:hypothetical protein